MGFIKRLTGWLRGQSSKGQAEYYSLFSAAQAGDAKAVKKLISKGKDVNKGEWDGLKPLHAAAAGCHTECVRLLINKGADINANSWMGTALHCGIQNDNMEMVKLLLERGANPNIVGNTTGERCGGSPPLVVAAGKGCGPLVELLLRHGADPNIPSGSTKLLPIDATKEDAIKALLQKAMDFAEEKQREKKQEEENSLESVFPKVRAALRYLPVSDEELLRSQIRRIAEKWGHRIVEGNAEKIETSLLKCFKDDLRGENFYFEIHSDPGNPYMWDKGVHNAFIRCGRGMHNVGRYGKHHYIAIFHARC